MSKAKSSIPLLEQEVKNAAGRIAPGEAPLPEEGLTRCSRPWFQPYIARREFL